MAGGLTAQTWGLFSVFCDCLGCIVQKSHTCITGDKHVKAFSLHYVRGTVCLAQWTKPVVPKLGFAEGLEGRCFFVCFLRYLRHSGKGPPLNKWLAPPNQKFRKSSKILLSTKGGPGKKSLGNH